MMEENSDWTFKAQSKDGRTGWGVISDVGATASSWFAGKHNRCGGYAFLMNRLI